MQQFNEDFLKRVQDHIKLSNSQLSADVKSGEVTASMMYSSARFSAWLSATGFNSGETMAESKQETIEYFMGEYRKMLEANFEEFVQNFDSHMSVEKK